jgi:hypothetical protein
MQGENRNSLEHIAEKIYGISEDIQEIKQDLKETRNFMHTEISNLKLQQEKCASRWEIFGRTLSGSGIIGVLGYLVTAIFPKPQ